MGRSCVLLTAAAVLALLLPVVTGCSFPRVVASPTASLRSPLAGTAVASATPTVTTVPTSLSSGPTQERGMATGDQMEITVSQDIYQAGEEVTFAITNRSDQVLYYVYGGCGWPTIRKVDGDDLTPLVTQRIESVPHPTEVGPGETHICSWDQRVWQDPDRQGPARFAYYIERAPVPPGQYQFVLVAYLEWEDALSLENRRTTHSRIFSIE